MALWKVTMIFSDQGYGWSESYYLNLSSPQTPQSVYALYGQPLSNVRLPITGNSTALDFVRVSQVNVPFAAIAFRDGRMGTYNVASLFPNVALLVRAQQVAVGPQKNIFMRGLPYTIVKAGEYAPPDVFNGPLKAFFNYLAPPQGLLWGWLGVTSKVSSPVTGYTVTLGFQVVVTTLNPIFPVTTPPARISVRFTGINGKSELNGQQVVTCTNATTCQTVDQFGVIPYTHGGKVTVQTKSFVPFNSFVDERINTRKAGRIAFLERGRAAVRAKT